MMSYVSSGLREAVTAGTYQEVRSVDRTQILWIHAAQSLRPREIAMPTFQVLRRVDAFVDYVAEVDAPDADQAAAAAAGDERRFEWKKVGVAQFDDRLFVALDERGDEIDSTQRGDF